MCALLLSSSSYSSSFTLLFFNPLIHLLLLLSLAVAVGSSKWGKHYLRPVSMPPERNRSSFPSSVSDWEAGAALALGIEGAQEGSGQGQREGQGQGQGEMVTPAVAVSRLFFENKVKAITASLPSSPRTSITLPKRDWGYSPYASTSFDPPKRCLESSPLDPPSLPADGSSNRATIDQPSFLRSVGTGNGAAAGLGQGQGIGQGVREEEILRALDFAERKAIFQSNKGQQGAGVCKGDTHTTVSPQRNARSAYGCGTNITSPSNKSPEFLTFREKVKDTLKEREREASEENSRVVAVNTPRRGAEEAKGGGTGAGTGAMSVKDIVSAWSSVVKETSVLRGKVKA